ncbi:MAG TPA: hypothetical protein VMD59_04060, partial [Acidimicrobiales bacterium]|nr:hypothetical protein [Acidimicrobiales bacterium]
LPPLVLAVIDDLLRRRRRSALLDGALLGVLAAAQLLIDAEVLAELTVVLVGAAVLLAAVSWRRVAAWLAVAGGRLAVGAGASLGAFGLLAAWPLWAMLEGAGHLSGAVQPPARLQGYHIDLVELVLPPKPQLVDFPALAAAGRAAVATAVARGDPEHTGYLGLPLVLLAIVLVACWRRSTPVRCGAAIALTALVAALGPRLDIDGHTTSLLLPEGLLAHVPLLSSAIPSRFTLELVLGVAVVVAAGLDATRAARGWPSAPGGLALAGTAVALACYLPQYPLASSALPPEGAVLAALRSDVAPGAVVLTYPYALPPYDEAMLWQARDSMGFVLMGGYLTVRGEGPDGSGQYYPPLLEPASVQEALELDELGRPLHYPRPRAKAVAAPALCSFLERYSVSDVVMRLGPLVPHEGRVERLLVDALGRPRRVEKGALLWRAAGSSGAGGHPDWTCRATRLGVVSRRPARSAPRPVRDESPRRAQLGVEGAAVGLLGVEQLPERR